MRIANENGVTLAALVAVNGAETATVPLHPGQELKLPAQSPDPKTQIADGTASALSLIEAGPGVSAKTDSLSASNLAKSTQPSSDSGKIYVIGKGENVYTIAQKLKVSTESLLKLNQIDDPKRLKPGQKLRIPLTSKTRAR